MDVQQTPHANRLHIGIYGKRNSGKSSLLNAITKQEVSMVSAIPGTTTDPVYKAMELHGIGPVVFIDTAGFDDEGILGTMRNEKTNQMIEKTDIAMLLFHDENIADEVKWYRMFKKRNIPVVAIINQRDECVYPPSFITKIEKELHDEVCIINVKTTNFIANITERLIRILPSDYEEESIAGHLIKANDIVLLVMPQDLQAPKGRLILPQVQTIRDLLDHQCIVQSCTLDQLDVALDSLKNPPSLIITDSQVFAQVYAKKPSTSLLTSFSVLFAKYKGDIHYFIESAKQLDRLTEASRVLIMEACTHAPLSEDIGRVKIPNLLKKKVGSGLTIDIMSGANFPEDLCEYDMIIHCGACMFNKKHVMSRVEKAKKAGVAMSNYGVCIAYLNHILDKIII